MIPVIVPLVLCAICGVIGWAMRGFHETDKRRQPPVYLPTAYQIREWNRWKRKHESSK